MKLSTTLALTVFGLTAVAGARVPDDVASAAQARIGEVRMIAVAPDNQTVAAQLHHDGWLEARGQVLPIAAFPELYRVVGRTWTSDRVAEGRFAVPQLLDRSQRRLSSDNPFGVLGPGDLVTSGTTSGRTPYVPLTVWIFAGRTVTDGSAGGAAVR
jgi:hypothetical protein